MAASGLIQELIATGRRRAFARVLGLMIAAALIEGLALVLFVPMLAVLGGASIGGHALLRWLAAAGVPVALAPLLAAFVALALARVGIAHARDVADQRLEFGVVDGLRARAWRALLHCDWRVLATMRQSESASLLLGAIDRVGFGLHNFLSALSSLVTLGGIALAALVIAPRIALAAAICGALLVLAQRRLRRRAARFGERLTEAFAEVHERYDEGLGALRVIKSFGAEERAAASGAAAVRALRETQAAAARELGLGQIALQGGGALLLAALVWLGVTRWHAGGAQLLPLVALFARALPLLGGFQHAWQSWEFARPALAAAHATIARAEAAREPDEAPAGRAPTAVRAIALRGVSVRFAGAERPALDGVDLVLPARSITALIGPSGAGKSTLADVLGGLIVPERGALVVDDAELADGSRRGWRRSVTYVQQDGLLFTGTIRDNLRWADPAADDARMLAALRQASAGFVEALPEGLGTRVGEGARTLSGGERQRIVLARALLREPRLLILDEATSALDPANEAAIAQAVARLRARMTIVVIGHRGALTEIADRTVTIAEGRIVADTRTEAGAALSRIQ